MPKSQMMTVLQTSASDRETGDICLETVTAMGTEMAIDMISPALSKSKKVFDLMSSQYPLMFYKYSLPLTFTQFSSLQGHGTCWNAIVNGSMTIKPYRPSKKTSFKALSSYLLKIHFS